MKRARKPTAGQVAGALNDLELLFGRAGEPEARGAVERDEAPAAAGEPGHADGGGGAELRAGRDEPGAQEAPGGHYGAREAGTDVNGRFWPRKAAHYICGLQTREERRAALEGLEEPWRSWVRDLVARAFQGAKK